MTTIETLKPWDYLIVTASNDAQARAYEFQIRVRRELGLLAGIRDVLVVADPGGKRIGSGGSTLLCLMEVLDRERAAGAVASSGREGLEEILRGLRILIIHAGGDSRRLPAYGPCGKIFVPVPGDSDCALAPTIFDRLLPSFLALPPGRSGAGQVVVASGDALIRFEPEPVRLDAPGIVALGCNASPEEASNHGVFCLDNHDGVRIYLQKPEPAAQARVGAVNRYGQTVLDIGVMSFDATTAIALLGAFEVDPARSGNLAWSDPMKELILEQGLDLYREICCALGAEATAAHHFASAHHSGSTWGEEHLGKIHAALGRVPFQVQVLDRCSFLHFGTSRQLIASGLDLLQQDLGVVQPGALLPVNTEISSPPGQILGGNAWVEGCRVTSALRLGGQNVVVGVDVAGPVSLPAKACLDVVAGRDRRGRPVWFVRPYGLEDTFKDPATKGGTFFGIPLLKWIETVGAKPEDIWDPAIPPESRTLWDARVFPAEKEHSGYHRWLWMIDPREVPEVEKKAFLHADRYSTAEISLLADQEAFYARRSRLRSEGIRRSLRRMFRNDSGFSADELAHALASAPDRSTWAAEILADAHWHLGADPSGHGMETFVFCRILHSLATAVSSLQGGKEGRLEDVLPGIGEKVPTDMTVWLGTLGLAPRHGLKADEWCRRAKEVVFEKIRETILRDRWGPEAQPRNALRPDETIWGRAPARIELGGGWTDTPPCTLERGGTVANAAVDLNGQPPIHCYCRVIREPVIRLSSMDVGEHIEIREMDGLVDFRRPEDPFSLAKAALAISGFAPRFSNVPEGTPLRKVLEDFGGGIELTTLVGIPKGSGLGTSSINGAVVLAVILRMLGRPYNLKEHFHDVLRLEQALASGGGWQDQVGACVGGTKITTTSPGLFPDWRIHYIPSDILDPRTNGGATLLYYTGLQRPAKNIIRQVVGGYLDRNRSILSILEQEHQVAKCISDAMARKDAAMFGYSIDVAWRLQKGLCGNEADDAVEELLARVRPHIHGARILGAGGGGFLLMVCKTPADARKVRELLEERPLNERSRFFDFEVNAHGLEVTAC
jgi:fucokinase